MTSATSFAVREVGDLPVAFDHAGGWGLVPGFFRRSSIAFGSRFATSIAFASEVFLTPEASAVPGGASAATNTSARRKTAIA